MTQTHKSYELVHLSPEQLQFTRTGDTLSLQMADRYARVALRSCFPVAKGGTYLSVRDANTEEQDEIGIIDDWYVLRGNDRSAVAAELGLLLLCAPYQACCCHQRGVWLPLLDRGYQGHPPVCDAQ